MDTAPGHPEIERVVAPNPGAMTLDGTNTYVVEAEGGAWVIDPGPQDDRHLEAVRAAAARRGSLAGILLTHSHIDHSAGVPGLDAPLVWGTVGTGDEGSSASGAGAEGEGWPAQPDEGRAGPFRIVPTPGHSVDHVCIVFGEVCFCGDLVLGRGSSFVPPDGGSLAAYIDSLRRVRDLGSELLCPGHGPFITDPAAKLDEYLAHRLDRERKLLEALEAGERSRARLLRAAWDDVPADLLPAASLVMEAHVEKLAAEGRLPGPLAD